MEKLVISDESDIELNINIDGVKIVSCCNITKEDLIKILKIIGYGNTGWEKYNLVEIVQLKNLLE